MAISIPNIQPPFSMQAFLHGLIAAGAVFVLLLGWMALRADDTKMQLQKDMPSKTAIIETQKQHKPDMAHSADHHEEASAQQTPLNTALSETVEGRIVPRADIQTGLTPFKFYRRPATLTPGQAGISVILMDAGLAKTLTEKANETLPAEITMAFSPYADAITVQTSALRDKEREFWIHIPFQNETYPNPDPGPATLLMNASIEQNNARLLDLLSTIQGYTGLISYPDHAYYNADPNAGSILPQIFGRGLGFIEGRPNKPFFGSRLALENMYPFGQVDFLVQETDTPDMIERRFVQTENKATQTGRALIMMPLTPLSVAMLSEWTGSLADKSIQLAPASALLNNNE